MLFRDQITKAGLSLSVASNIADYIDREVGQRWLQETREISAMLVGLRRSIERGK